MVVSTHVTSSGVQEWVINYDDGDMEELEFSELSQSLLPLPPPPPGGHIHTRFLPCGRMQFANDFGDGKALEWQFPGES
jgi:hypothetical protein